MAEQEVKPCEFANGACIHCEATERGGCEGYVCNDSLYASYTKREWVGLTDEEVQFYRKKYSRLFNAGYDKVTDTNLIAEEFDSIGFYKEVSAALKERNHG